MEENDLDLVAALKTLEGNNFDSEVALFDALSEAGIELPKGYRSGSRNKELARKEADRYVEYKPRREVDPAYKNKRAVTIVRIHDPPKTREDQRGTRGRYADYLKPLIVKTAIDFQFHGTKTELFDLWGVHARYRDEQIETGQFNPQKGHGFNPWPVTKTTPPGEAKYHQVISFKERNSLETALDSLSKEQIIEWMPYIKFVPIIKTSDLVNSIDRINTWKEYTEDCDKRLELVTHLAESKNCVLSPELFQTGLYVPRELFNWWTERYNASGGKELPNESATQAQEIMYENYQEYVRQLTISDCSDTEKLCPVDSIPGKYDIFTDWTYRRKYSDLDKIWKPQLLGWEQVRKEVYFKMLDEERGAKYLNRYSPELSFGLGCEYILYMDAHLEKERIYYPKNFTSDFEGIISNRGSDRLFPLSTSRSATQLHDKLMKLYALKNY